MDQKQLRSREAQCIQENPPGCTAGCPVHVDVRGMLDAVRKQDYTAGFALFHRMVPFPGIISRVCDQPCRRYCKRGELDEAISIRALEQICVDYNQTITKTPSLPVKKPQVAVVGAGLSGLTAAMELARKGYEAVVFEAAGQPGGRLRTIPENRLPRQVLDRDFELLASYAVKLQLHHPVGNRPDANRSLDSLRQEFAAVYLGIGAESSALQELGLELDNAGAVAVDAQTLATSQAGVFAGGSSRQRPSAWSPIASIADGKSAAISIDRLLQNASLTASRERAGSCRTRLYTNIDGIAPQALTPMASPALGYSREEALQEAGRCLACECRECVKKCEFLAHYRSYPKRYVREVYNNLSIVMGIHHANKMINSCSLCGLCAHICPEHLAMGEVFLEARQTMVAKGKMPPSAHDFALRDMQFSNSRQFSLCRHQPGHLSSKAVFYPGCQLAASSPEAVTALYRFLCDKLTGGVGLMLGCCGAPAGWAGQTALFQETMKTVEDNWRKLGSPAILTACPTCFSMFRHNLPDIPLETVWTLLDRTGLPPAAQPASQPSRLAVHDSCTTRYEAGLQAGVRSIAGKLGYEIEELPDNREHTVCCGYGGLMSCASQEVARKVIDRRITESSSDYLVYCAMCRDNFAGRGKRVHHLLDLILGRSHDRASRPGPGYSDRQENRAKLKISLCREVWGERVEAPEAEFQVIIPEKVRQVLDDRRILADEVKAVIAYAERTGNKLRDNDRGHYIAYLQPVSVTYWVEYSPCAGGFTVHNAYCHRLEING